MLPETCPLCGTPVAPLAPMTPRSEADLLRDRIATLRQRADVLEQGDVTPQQLEDELLWMGADRQRVTTNLPEWDRQEIQRRIHEQARQLEERRRHLTRRAS